MCWVRLELAEKGKRVRESREDQRSSAVETGPSPSGPARPRSGQVKPSSHTILVADADARTRYELAYALRGAGFQTLQADSGARALQFAEHVSAALLDVDLADVSGVEICRVLRRTPRTATLPVIHICAASIEHEAAMDAGADAYLPRPVDPQRLAATVADLLARSGTL